jgi:ABC-type phosphate/phosphonate transport system permease subunit
MTLFDTNEHTIYDCFQNHSKMRLRHYNTKTTQTIKQTRLDFCGSTVNAFVVAIMMASLITVHDLISAVLKLLLNNATIHLNNDTHF